MEPGSEKQFKARIESAIKFVIKKPGNGGVKLPFGCTGARRRAGGRRMNLRKLNQFLGIYENCINSIFYICTLLRSNV